MGEDQALARLHAILARPEFQADGSAAWWQQLLGPLFTTAWNLLAQLVQLLLDTTTGREGSIGLVVLVVCASLLMLAAAYLVRTVRLAVVREAEVRSASLAQRRERSDQLWRTAQQLAAAGDLEHAVVQAYLSALYALDERALLHVEVNLTNREHAQRLAQQHPVLGDSFEELVERYERVRYGRAAVGAETFTHVSALALHVRSAALASANT
ncbi:MAG: DUF4129 domain-containing protein [Chloroflexi bacterium]|nr:DUF4129 domain-containing protein [Chloroflexota bacterium]